MNYNFRRDILSYHITTLNTKISLTCHILRQSNVIHINVNTITNFQLYFVNKNHITEDIMIHISCNSKEWEFQLQPRKGTPCLMIARRKSPLTSSFIWTIITKPTFLIVSTIWSTSMWISSIIITAIYHNYLFLIILLLPQLWISHHQHIIYSRKMDKRINL